MFYKQFLIAVRSFLDRFGRHESADVASHAPPPKQLGHYAACMISRDSLPH
jgi:hypothetical protein